jgi:recombination protein RecT
MKTDGSNTNTKLEKADTGSLRGLIASMSKEIERALPKGVTADRMARIAMTAVSKNPKLGSCTQQSFLGSLLTSMQLGLEVNTPLGQSYLIPRMNKKANAMECNFQMGYQGVLELCYRSGMYKKIKAVAVYEGDQFDYAYGSSEQIIHVPCGKPDKVKFIYAIYKLTNGGEDFEVWPWQQVLDHARKNSESWDSEKSDFRYGSAWRDDPIAMGKKTVLLALLKYAPKSVELSTAVTSDDHVIAMRTVQDGETTIPFTEPVQYEQEEITEQQEDPSTVILAKAAAKETVTIKTVKPAEPVNMEAELFKEAQELGMTSAPDFGA